MQARRHSMMSRVARRYMRVPGQHGDGSAPAFYPVPINPSFWGQPFAKVGDVKGYTYFCMFVLFPVSFYYIIDVTILQRMRVAIVGTRTSAVSFWFKQTDLDDPDYAIKYAKLQEEQAANKLDVRWGGTNFLASYLWEPGDPEPDIRRREAPVHH